MASWTKKSKSSASWNNKSKNISIWDTEGSQLLLQENGYFLLLESGGRIVLEQSSVITPATWTNLTKN